MIFLGDLTKITDTKYSIGFIHYMPFDSQNGLGKTQEQLEEQGILLDSIPEPQQIEGKQSIMYWNPVDKKVFYEYEDIPKTQEQTQQEILAQTVADLTLQNADLVNQMQTLSQTIAQMQLG